MKRKNISKQKFGPLVAIRYINKNKRGQALWLFQCDCGNEIVLPATKVCDRPRTICNRQQCGLMQTEEEYKRKAKIHRDKNKEKAQIYHKEYKKLNEVKLKLKAKEYRKRTLYKRKEKYKNDINHQIAEKLRNRIRGAIKRSNIDKIGSAVNDLGCSLEKFKLWVEMHWTEGMSWNNYNFYGWHLDHIKPLSSFNLSNRKEFLEACHFTNIQPMWMKDNLSKGNKYDDHNH